MRYDVRVSDGSRFQYEQDDEQWEPLKVGDQFHWLSIAYEVTSITPLSADDDSDEFDAIADVKRMAGPGEVGFVHG